MITMPSVGKLRKASLSNCGWHPVQCLPWVSRCDALHHFALYRFRRRQRCRSGMKKISRHARYLLIARQCFLCAGNRGTMMRTAHCDCSGPLMRHSTQQNNAIGGTKGIARRALVLHLHRFNFEQVSTAPSPLAAASTAQSAALNDTSPAPTKQI